MRLPDTVAPSYSLEWFSIEFNRKSCIFNCDQVSNEIAEIVGNAYKGDHNNYFAAVYVWETRRRGSARLSAKLIDVGARRTRQTRATLPYTYVLTKT